MAARMCTTLGEQPPKITTELAKFSAEFEKVIGINEGVAGVSVGCRPPPDRPRRGPNAGEFQNENCWSSFCRG